MKISMPKIVVPPFVDELPRIRPCLVKSKSTGKEATVIRGRDEVMFFETDGTDGRITYLTARDGRFDKAWFDDNYTIIREYATGDVLTIAG